MSRVKRGTVTKKRHKRLLKQTKGFWGQRKNIFRRAKETLLRAMAFSFVGRKQKKRTFRRLWITRINSASKLKNLTYSKVIHNFKKSNIELNRKMLSQIAILDAQTFDKLITSEI